jgi:hypothetical protein
MSPAAAPERRLAVGGGPAAGPSRFRGHLDSHE